MLVEHFRGQKECNNLKELRKVLGERTEKGVNDAPVLDADGISIFYTNTDSEEIEVANYSIIEIEDAVSAVEEFFETLQLPKCIEWEEL